MYLQGKGLYFSFFPDAPGGEELFRPNTAWSRRIYLLRDAEHRCRVARYITYFGIVTLFGVLSITCCLLPYVPARLAFGVVIGAVIVATLSALLAAIWAGNRLARREGLLPYHGKVVEFMDDF